MWEVVSWAAVVLYVEQNYEKYIDKFQNHTS